MERLRERGVMSMAINNAGAYAPVTAHTFGDPQTKFHSAMFLDPKVLSFVPFGKLFYSLQVKHGGEFYPTDIKPVDCPSVFGFSRRSEYDAGTFLTTPFAHWGNGHEEAEKRNTYRRLCTMLLGFRILHYLGAPRIFVIGADFHVPPKDSDTPGYAWGDNASCNNKIWWKIDQYMRGIRPVMAAAGVDIYNCNPVSQCEAFDYVSFDDAVVDCKGGIEAEPLDCHDWYNKKQHEADHARHPEKLTAQQLAELRVVSH